LIEESLIIEDSILNNKRGITLNKLNTFLFTMVILSFMIGLVPTSKAEPYEDFYADKKQFSYMDICKDYMTWNSGDTDITNNLDRATTNVNSNTYTLPGEPNKPTKTILFDNEVVSNNMIALVSRLVYDWGPNDEIKIKLMYIPTDSATKETLRIFYTDYHDESLANEMAYEYVYIDEPKSVWLNPSSTSQRAQQRLSNYDNTRSTNSGSIFYNYTKKYGGGDETELKVQEVTLYTEKSIPTNQWYELKVPATDLFDSGNIYLHNNFMHMGIRKSETGDILIISDIIISSPTISENNLIRPSLEYYEFTNITSDYTTQELVNIDFITNDYDSQRIYNFSMSLEVEASGYTRLHYTVNGTHYGVPYLFTGGTTFFAGYQLNVQKQIGSNKYDIHIYYKYAYTERGAAGEITYRYRYIHIDISTVDIVGILKVDRFSTHASEYNVYYTEQSHKWDIKDNEFTVIDSDLKADQQLLLIKDIDSSGFKFPSLNDIKKVILSAFAPLFILLASITNTILIPIAEMIGIMDDITGIIETINTAVTSAVSGITAVSDAISDFKDAFDTAIGPLSDIATDMSLILSNVIQFAANLILLMATTTNILDFLNAFVGIANWIGTNAIAIFTGLANGTPFFLSWLTNMFFVLTTYLEIAFSLVAMVFIWSLLIHLYKFNETEDISYLYEMLEVYYRMADTIIGYLKLFIQFVAGIIP